MSNPEGEYYLELEGLNYKDAILHTLFIMNQCPINHDKFGKETTLNHIEIRRMHKGGNWQDFEWFIDGIRLCQYLTDKKSIELPELIEPFLVLLIMVFSEIGKYIYSWKE